MDDQFMNIYQMYIANGERAGFHVRRDSWSSIYAEVKAIGGIAEGPLTGMPPYFGNPPVIADVYDNNGLLKQAAAVLSGPGTFAYARIDPPR